MKYALINPNWDFCRSIYFGCREPHLPLEYGYAKALLENDGHEVLLVDGHLEGISREEIVRRVGQFRPDFTVVTTAPSYLFWRCPPPELRVPQDLVGDLRKVGGTMVAVGPHGSTTPRSVAKKLGVDLLLIGEFEDLLPKLAIRNSEDWRELSSICVRCGDEARVHGAAHTSDLKALPALRWPAELVRSHSHHHHRFDAVPEGFGAEVEASRGCPYRCVFCAKEHFRNRYRRRPLSIVLDEIDHLVEQGVAYIYFIDEIFMPYRDLLDALEERYVKFGVQLRIDLWSPDMLESLGRAGCVSIEAGIENISESGRGLVGKNSELSFDELTERLLVAKSYIPFVQANLIDAKLDDPNAVRAWREMLQRHGVWANKPVPMFPYPGSPLYRKLWGFPDDHAWERAHAHYLGVYAEYSDIQEQQPLSLSQLELKPIW